MSLGLIIVTHFTVYNIHIISICVQGFQKKRPLRIFKTYWMIFSKTDFEF